jgi:outer membrane lipoprotein-sorting protein
MIRLSLTVFAAGVALALTAAGAGAQPLPAAAPAPPPPLSSSDQALVNRAAAYLEGLTEARARFTQIDPRGRASAGDIYLKRPGKARFDYDKPSYQLIVSDGSQVLVQDRRLKTFENYPLRSTALALFLARHVRLDQGVNVTSIDRRPGQFSITAQDRRREAQGTLILDFAESPMALLGWTVIDPQGGHTRVRLTGLRAVRGLDPALFVLRDTRLPAPMR